MAADKLKSCRQVNLVKKKLILQCQTDFLFEQLFFYYTPNS